MKKMMAEYGFSAMFIGCFIGILLGLGGTYYLKKSLKSIMLIPSVSITAIICAGSAYGIGKKMGKQAYIIETLGIKNPIEDVVYKEGRFWVGITKWVDKRNNQEFEIRTQRINGTLCSLFNNQIFKNYGIPNANQQTVPKFHNQAKEEVFAKLTNGFTENL